MDESVSHSTARPAPVLTRRRQLELVGAALAIVLIGFLVLPALSHLLFPPPQEAEAKPDDGTFAATPKQWATLRFEPVRLQNFADIVVTDGKIAVDDDRTTQVFSPFTGRVTRIFVKPGDQVRAGTPLFAVQAGEFVQAQSDLVAADGGLTTARAQLKLTQDAEARQHDLFNHQGAALKDWQQSQVDLATAQAGLRNAEAARAAVIGRLRILGVGDRAIAGLSAHGAAADRTEAIVRAPVAGTVTQRLIGIGQNIGSVAGGGSATQAMAISDFSRVWIVGNLREEDAMRAHLGQPAEVRLLVQPDVPIRARVDYIAPSLDPATRRLTVRAEVENPGGMLKPEMFANFSLLTGGERMSLSVPTASVIYEGASARVWVARASDHHLGLRFVTTGTTVGDRVEIKSGLKPGDVVVTAGSLFIDRGAQSD